MPIDMKVLGQIRGVFTGLFAEGREDQQIQLNGQGDQLIAAGSAPYQEIVRQGLSFVLNPTAAIASVIAIPTTAHAFALYNPEPDQGRSLIIDRVWALFTFNSGAALTHAGIIGNLGQVRETAPADSGLVPRQLNGGGGVGRVATSILGATALPAGTGIAANWFALGPSVNSAVLALPGFQQSVNVDGRIIVPPGRYFAVHTLASVITCSAICGIEWTEKVILNG